MANNIAVFTQSLTTLEQEVSNDYSKGITGRKNDDVKLQLRQLIEFLHIQEAAKTANEFERPFFKSANKLIQQFIPRSTDDQFIQCAAYGALYREQHKTIKTPYNATPYAKYEALSPVSIANILPIFIKFIRIGEENDGSAQLHAYDLDRGIYSSDSWFIDRFIDAMQSGITERNAKEIRRWIDQHVDFRKPTKNQLLTVMGNGIFDAKEKKLLPFTDEYIFTTKISVNFNPQATHPEFESGWTWAQFLLDQFPAAEDQKMAWQLIQYTLLTNMPKGVYMYLYDPIGNTGKSMFARIIRNLVGERNFGMANLQQFENKFTTAGIYDKSFIYGDENDASFVQFNELMKSMSTGESISVERKSQDIFKATITPMIVQSMNSTPTFKHIDGGTKRRMRILEFKKSYSGVENTEIKSKNIYDTNFLEWIAYQSLMAPVEKFTDSDNSQRIKGEIERESNPILEYATDRFSRFQGDVIPIWLAFADFQVWLRQENKTTSRTKVRFVKEMKIVLTNMGWSVPEHPIRMTKFLESDYNQFYEDYLRTNINSMSDRYLQFSQESAKFKRLHKSFCRNID